jgi:hypothetical protein
MLRVAPVSLLSCWLLLTSTISSLVNAGTNDLSNLQILCDTCNRKERRAALQSKARRQNICKWQLSGGINEVMRSPRALKRPSGASSTGESSRSISGISNPVMVMSNSVSIVKRCCSSIARIDLSQQAFSASLLSAITYARIASVDRSFS